MPSLVESFVFLCQCLQRLATHRPLVVLIEWNSWPIALIEFISGVNSSFSGRESELSLSLSACLQHWGLSWQKKLSAQFTLAEWFWSTRAAVRSDWDDCLMSAWPDGWMYTGQWPQMIIKRENCWEGEWRHPLEESTIIHWQWAVSVVLCRAHWADFWLFFSNWQRSFYWAAEWN